MVGEENYEIRESTRGKSFLSNNVNGMSRGSKVKILYNHQEPQEGYLATYSDYEKQYVPMYGGTYISGYLLILTSSVAVVLITVKHLYVLSSKNNFISKANMAERNIV